jgi:hypothetical protein
MWSGLAGSVRGHQAGSAAIAVGAGRTSARLRSRPPGDPETAGRASRPLRRGLEGGRAGGGPVKGDPPDAMRRVPRRALVRRVLVDDRRSLPVARSPACRNDFALLPDRQDLLRAPLLRRRGRTKRLARRGAARRCGRRPPAEPARLRRAANGSRNVAGADASATNRPVAERTAAAAPPSPEERPSGPAWYTSRNVPFAESAKAHLRLRRRQQLTSPRARSSRQEQEDPDGGPAPPGSASPRRLALIARPSARVPRPAGPLTEEVLVARLRNVTEPARRVGPSHPPQSTRRASEALQLPQRRSAEHLEDPPSRDTTRRRAFQPSPRRSIAARTPTRREFGERAYAAPRAADRLRALTPPDDARNLRRRGGRLANSDLDHDVRVPRGPGAAGRSAAGAAAVDRVIRSASRERPVRGPPAWAAARPKTRIDGSASSRGSRTSRPRDEVRAVRGDLRGRMAPPAPAARPQAAIPEPYVAHEDPRPSPPPSISNLDPPTPHASSVVLDQTSSLTAEAPPLRRLLRRRAVGMTVPSRRWNARHSQRSFIAQRRVLRRAASRHLHLATIHKPDDSHERNSSRMSAKMSKSLPECSASSAVLARPRPAGHRTVPDIRQP